MELPFTFENLTAQDERSFFLRIPADHSMIFATLLIASLVWGSYMKYLTYSYLNRVKIVEKPINLIILLSQTTHHMLHLFLGANILVELILKMSPIEFAKKYVNLDLNESTYCTPLYFLAAFNTTYLAVGNSFLAMYRFIYLTMTSVATKMIGEKRCIASIIFGGFLVSGVISWLFVSKRSTTRAIFNLCAGRSQKFQVK